MNPIVVPWLVEVGLITWRDVRIWKRPPAPSELLATFIVFGGASLIPDRRFGSVVGWGMVIATFLNLFDPTLANPTGKAFQQVQPADKVVGGTAA